MHGWLGKCGCSHCVLFLFKQKRALVFGAKTPVHVFFFMCTHVVAGHVECICECMYVCVCVNMCQHAVMVCMYACVNGNVCRRLHLLRQNILKPITFSLIFSSAKSFVYVCVVCMYACCDGVCLCVCVCICNVVCVNVCMFDGICVSMHVCVCGLLKGVGGWADCALSLSLSVILCPYFRFVYLPASEQIWSEVVSFLWYQDCVCGLTTSTEWRKLITSTTCEHHQELYSFAVFASFQRRHSFWCLLMNVWLSLRACAILTRVMCSPPQCDGAQLCSSFRSS